MMRRATIPLRGLLYAPVASFDWMFRRVGHRRAIPWLSYRAVRDIGRLLTQDSRVLEFGAGMSTIWFARRVAKVVSVESDPEWHVRVLATLPRGLNVEFRLRPVFGVDSDSNERSDPDGCTRYADVSDLADGSFDFALIDGACRVHCVPAAIAKVRKGGFIYIDNTDVDGREAGVALIQSGRCKTIRYYTDFTPGLAFAAEGLLAHI